jgi:hypothetical protein
MANRVADRAVALDVSGAAVDAEFEKRLRQMVSPNDYRGDVEQLFYEICREFKEEKKDCGDPKMRFSPTWNIHAPRLRENPGKGFKKDCMRISRYILSELLRWTLAKIKQNITRAVF